MITQLIIGALLIGLTVVFHAFALDFIIRKADWLEETGIRKFKKMRQALLLTAVVLAVTFALIVEIWIWAVFYLIVDALPDLETALYFSISTFTTVGYGDVVLGTDWRLLSSIEATNGFLLFGWSTAFIFEVVARIYQKEGRALQQ